MLFVGDLGPTAMNDLLQENGGTSLKSSVLKVSHHGHENSTTTEVINQVQPHYLLICMDHANWVRADNIAQTYAPYDVGIVAYTGKVSDDISTIIFRNDNSISLTNCFVEQQ